MKIKSSFWTLVFLLIVNCSHQREIIILSHNDKNKLTIFPGYEQDGRKYPAAEAKLVDYARMKFNLDSTRNYNVITHLGGVVNKELPFQSPWRVVMIGKVLREVTLTTRRLM